MLCNYWSLLRRGKKTRVSRIVDTMAVTFALLVLPMLAKGFVVVPGRSVVSRPTTTLTKVPQPRSLPVLSMWQPPRSPGGDGFSLAPVAFLAFVFLFPGFFFGLLNVFLFAGLVLPPVLSFAFQQWSNRNLITAPCPRCQSPVSSLKEAPETVCFNCGSELVATTNLDSWRLRSVYDDDAAQSSRDRDSGNAGRSSPGVIDVEATVE